MDNESELLTIAYMQGAASKADEIRALRDSFKYALDIRDAEIERLKDERDALRDSFDAQLSIAANLMVERDALKADASRFIWLADRLQDIAIDLAEPVRFIDDRGDWVNAWRAAIDAAWEGE